jgi:hypothetical protein
MEDEPEPRYHISVVMNLNPFLPISYVTQVHGAVPTRGLMGQFECVMCIAYGVSDTL